MRRAEIEGVTIRIICRWRGLAARREVRSLRMVVAASLEEAAAAAAEKQVEARLAAESARLLAGLQLSSAAVLRGDGAKLQAVYGPAAAVIHVWHLADPICNR